MIDPIQIKQEVQEGKLLFWTKDGNLYCSDANPSTTTVIIPYNVKSHAKNKTPKYYIIQLLENYNDPTNTKEYNKNERIMVWDNRLSYVVVNSYHDSISKDYCKIVHDIDFKCR